MASAPARADQSLRRIAEITARLFDVPSLTIRLVDGEEWGPTINFGASSNWIRRQTPPERRRVAGENLPGAVYRASRQIDIPGLRDGLAKLMRQSADGIIENDDVLRIEDFATKRSA